MSISAFPRPEASPKSVLRRLMIPLAMLLFLLIAGFNVMMIQVYRERMEESSRWFLKEASRHLSQLLADQTELLTLLEDLLVRDPGLANALDAEDRNRLLTAYQPVFERFRTTYRITHFKFMDADRTVVLRLHKPGLHGDRINRLTPREAERTGRAASGIEIGRTGALVLRVAQPIRRYGEIIGYVEMGKEFEDLLGVIQRQLGMDLAVTVHKNAIDRDDWESSMRMLGREANWDRFATEALIHSTISPFPPELERFVGTSGKDFRTPISEAEFRDKPWHVISIPLVIQSGAEVGTLMLLRDISGLKAAQNRTISITGVATFLLLAGLFGFLFALLRRVDEGIRAQREALWASNERYMSIVQAQKEMIRRFRPDTTLTFVNAAYAQTFGKTPEELVGRSVLEFLPESRRMSIPNHLADLEKGTPSITYEQEIVLPDGERCWREWTDYALFSPEGEVVEFQSVGHDITRRRRAESMLERERTMLRTVIQTIPDLVWLKDPEGRYLGCNRRFASFLGMREADIVGKTDYDFTNRESADAFRANDLAAMESGRSVVSEESVVFASDGHQEDIEAIKAPIFDIDGRLTGVLGIGRDITERKRIERRIRRDATVLDGLTRLQREFLVEADSRRTFERMLTLLLEVTESRAGFIGEILETDAGTPFLRVHSVASDSWDEAARAAYRRKISEGFEFHHPDTPLGMILPSRKPVIADDATCRRWQDLLPDNHPFLESFLGIPFFHGESLIGMIGLANRSGGYDETMIRFLDPILATSSSLIQSLRIERERQAARAALQTEQSYLKAIIENQPGLIWLKDTEGRFLAVNRKFARSCGQERSDRIIGKSDRDFWPHELAEKYRRDDHMVMSNKTGITMEEPIFDQEQLRWFETFKMPVWDEAGRIIGTTGYAHDITDRKRTEEQVRHIQKTESLGRMAGAIAHHFNNQIGVVMGNLELALNVLPKESGVRDILLDATRGARRSAEVSGLMLTYLGQVAGEYGPMDLADLCRETLPMLQAAMPANVTLVTDLPAPGPAIRADKEQIRQLLTNLVTNAWESMEEAGGTIHLSAGRCPARRFRSPTGFPRTGGPMTMSMCAWKSGTRAGASGNGTWKTCSILFHHQIRGPGPGSRRGAGHRAGPRWGRDGGKRPWRRQRVPGFPASLPGRCPSPDGENECRNAGPAGNRNPAGRGRGTAPGNGLGHARASGHEGGGSRGWRGGRGNVPAPRRGYPLRSQRRMHAAHGRVGDPRGPARDPPRHPGDPEQRLQRGTGHARRSPRSAPVFPGQTLHDGGPEKSRGSGHDFPGPIPVLTERLPLHTIA